MDENRLPRIEQAHEAEMIRAGQEKFQDAQRRSIEKHRESHTATGRQLVEDCGERVTKAIQDHLNLAESHRGPKSIAVEKLSQFDSPEQAAALIAETIIDRISSKTPVTEICREIASALLDELRFQKFQRECPELYDWKREQNCHTDHYRHLKRTLDASGHRAAVDISEFKLNFGKRMQLGSACLALFKDATDYIEVIESEDFDPGTKSKPAVVVASQHIQEWQRQRNDVLQWRNPIYRPMFQQPEPWTDPRDGGYGFDLEDRLCLIQNRKGRSLKYLEEAKMPKVYQAINALQNTAWSVNEDVLEALRHLESLGHEKLGVPRHAPYIDKTTGEPTEFPKPDDIDINEAAKEAWKKVADAEHAKERKRLKEVGNYAPYIQAIKTAEGLLAQRDDNTGKPLPFYFPYRLDFRGRAYPVSLYLHPQGSDIQRGLLKFANGKALGSRKAVCWLAVHGANCLEVDPWAPSGTPKLTKRPFEDRVKWIEDHTSEICAVAENPFKNRWWAEKADSKACFLAFCFEWAEYSKMQADGQGLDFVSHLPIALDGSCNGFQHFGCLLLDEEIGKRVNLVPSETPQDIYEAVADRVRQRLAERAHPKSKATTKEQRKMAKALVKWGKLDRKFLKRNIMALPYGSNTIGFKKQYLEFLNDKDHVEYLSTFNEVIKTPKDRSATWFFLAQQVWAELEIMAPSAVGAMKWFKDLARIAAETNHPIRWKTPTGFIVNLDCRKQLTTENGNRKRVKTALGTRHFNTFRPEWKEDTNDIDKGKQVSTISANIIHSLDAAHMMLTVCAMQALEKLPPAIYEWTPTSYSIIHDSYATHAADTEMFLNRIKGAMADMYRKRKGRTILDGLQEDILSNVGPADLEKYRVPMQPKTGNLKLGLIYLSKFTFA